ncbi:ABC transporter substrate-binding protein [Algihabitans albus]|uniref:ABC transporter substrate-binding protein n=1 Tax=Algihabitans albus TaxID=2164067 RepID=UPI000E5D1628|nr:ABC transporter substrate-binding protein [Algihabitans albus]
MFPLRSIALLLGCGLLAASPLAAEPRAVPRFDEAMTAAQGQTVYFNAWGGDERINAYLDWVGAQMDARHGITLVHVKLSDTADAVARVLAERAAGNLEAGSVDLIWINGENFAAMKEADLLFGPFVPELPNFALVDTERKPTTVIDFTVPTDGLEAPWGMAKFNFIYDSDRISATPANAGELADWAASQPGRFTYPAPPDFMGSTFLKQLLIELTEDADLLQRPVESDDLFAQATAPLWSYLDGLHPHLWRSGQAFPTNGPAQRRLLDDGEVDMALSFHPGEASSLIVAGQLPDSARTFVFPEGTIGNTHFVAIPFNARSPEAAMVVTNFLMSPEAQAEKQNPEIWGDDTVLALDRLSDEARALFEAVPRGVATLAPEALGPVLLEPHPTWMTALEDDWRRRYLR